MFILFLLQLKQAGIPVGTRELLHLQEALQKEVVVYSSDDFYYLCRSLFVKKEQQLDKFDRCFASAFGALSELPFDPAALIPEEWLTKERELLQIPEEAKKPFLQELMQQLQQRFEALLKEQQERHQGGNKWIGTGGRSAFGAWGFNQQGYRIGQPESRHRRAVKVWDQRDFEALDDSQQLHTRQYQMALRRLRLLSKDNNEKVFDIAQTIQSTCKNGGLLKEEYLATRSNHMRLLVLFDIGGSMDEHVHRCAQLFSAIKHEFQQLEYFYFHNCLYEKIWKDPKRRRYDFSSTDMLFKTYHSQYRVVVVGDASMSPYELLYKGGSVEHVNEEPGAVWLQRLKEHFPHIAWLNPVDEKEWHFTETIAAIKKLMDQRMFPLSLQGLEAAVKALK